MKKILLITSTFILFSAINAQTSNIPVNYKTGTVFYPENINSYISLDKKENIVQNKYYKWVQFSVLPTQTQKEKMIALGMDFIEYIPKNTYLVSFPKGFAKSLLANKNISSVNEIEDLNRISEQASLAPFPEWAYEEGDVLLYLSFYNDLNFNTCIAKLKRNEISIKQKDAFTNNVVVKLDASKIQELLANKSIRYIDLISNPGEPEHDLSRNMHRSTSINSFYPSSRNYDGEGVAVCVNDDGIVGPHIDFTGRMNSVGVTLNLGTHGDMTTGIVAASGNLNPVNKGMAPACSVYVRQYNSTLPNTVTLHTGDSVQIFSSSYSNGCNAGYTTTTRKVDREIRLNPSLIQVFSAGNSNNNNCGYGAGNQWGNITGGHKVGKNVIATANLFTNTSLINSSSRGPAHDGRIKPDISANGNGNISTSPNNQYSPGGGTSAAAPGIAGVLTQLYHAHRKLKGTNPKSALMKAILLNSAEDYGNIGPDFKYGWGRVNALRALQTLEDTRYFSDTISTTGNNNHTITVPSGTKKVKVMVYWHDYEASVSASSALINDLNIKMTKGTTTYLPYLLNHTPNATTLNSPATTGRDSVNNVEQVVINNPVAGNYTLNVNGFSIPQGPQKYYVVYEFIKDEITLINPNGGEGYVPGETKRIFWDAHGTTGTFNLQYSINNGTSWSTISSSVAGSSRYTDWTVPNITTAEALVKITRGTVSDTSDHTFSIIRTPNNLQVIKVCPTYMEVSWNAVSGANQYQISLLGNKFMDSVGRTTSTTFQIPITNPMSVKWFSVLAIKNNTEGNIGRRANAKYYAGGLLNCPQNIDAGITDIINPSSNNCTSSGTMQVKIEISNLGLNSLSSIPVKYQINGGSVVSGTATPTISSGNTGIYTFTPSFTFTTSVAYIITVWTDYPGDMVSSNDTMETNFIYYPIQITPISENFGTFSNCSEASNCEVTICNLKNGWVNLKNGSQDDIDWRTNSGSTNSSGTGPSGDHTTGTGKYLYIEASGGCTNETAQLLSPCITVSSSLGSPYLTFYYYMRGSSVNTLSVDINNGTSWTNNVFSKTGSQGSVWRKASINLTSYSGNTIKIRINGTTGTSYLSDIAIDDINIADFVSIDKNDLSNSISIYPNPNNGNFKVEIIDVSLKNILLEIRDISGRIIHKQTINKQLNDINVSNLAKGIYTVTLKSEGKQTVKRIVIK